MQEPYRWGSRLRRLSRSEIRKMKENMQKVPLVQEKAERYHRQEMEKAEALLQKFEPLESSNKPELTLWKNQKHPQKNEKSWLLQKIKTYLFWK